MKDSANNRLLMLVDGHAVLHRAWHALPPLTTKDGRVVSGAYGFIMTLLGAIRNFQPTHLMVAFDLAGPTFRHEQYEDYKGTREEKPDELYEQIPILEEILELINVPVITADGYEADDAIGTAAAMASKKDKSMRTVIVTGDLDTLQLVTDRVSVFTMRRGITDTVTYDPDAVFERYGLKPTQMVDYKALRGDPSDNIPGVKGVGEKTASQLIAEFGSVDKLYQALDKGGAATESIKPKMQEKLLAGREDALQALDLCRIRTDAPIEFDLKAAVWEPVPRAVIKPLFEELQFNRLLTQWPGADDEPASDTAQTKPATSKAQASPQLSLIEGESTNPGTDAATNEPASLTTVADPAALGQVIKQLTKAKQVTLRTLVTDDQPGFPVAAGIGLRIKDTNYFLPADFAYKQRKLFAPFFADQKKRFVTHDRKREIEALTKLGLDLTAPTDDLMILSYLMYAGERRSSLEAMLAYYHNLPAIDKKADLDAQTDRLAVELERLVPLAQDLKTAVKENQMNGLYQDIELPLAPVLARMEMTGVLLDRQHFTKISGQLEKRLDKLTAEAYRLADGKFNLNSPGQIGEVLFERLGIETHGLKKTSNGKTPSTAASELEKIQDRHEIVPLLLEYRELAKLKSTYVDALPELAHPQTNRLHARFNQTVTATGRLSSSDPNLQNIPTASSDWGKQVRSGFIAAPGKTLVAADYSQIELRLAAHLSGEKTMIEAFKRGEDIHWRTAVHMFGEEEAANQRRLAKAINFGILYGMGPQRLAESAHITFHEASEYIERYFALLPGLSEYILAMKQQVADQGYVETMFGRRRFFPNFRLMNRREQAEAERQGVNTPLQGTQADMIKLAMIRADQALRDKWGDDARLTVQVHDELVFEVKDELVPDLVKLIDPIMREVIKLKVPILVNFQAGKNWGEMAYVA